MAAPTFTIQRVPDGEDVFGRTRARWVDFIPGNYNTGGYPVNASDLGMKMIYGVDVVGRNATGLNFSTTTNIQGFTGTATVQGVPVSSFLFVWTNVGGAEVTNNTTPAGSPVLRLQVFGK